MCIQAKYQQLTHKPVFNIIFFYSDLFFDIMSRFISLDKFVEEPKELITLNQIELYWGKLPYTPKSLSGRKEIIKLMNTLQKNQRAKVHDLNQKLAQQEYLNLKKNMIKFAKKQQSNFFSSLSDPSMLLETSSRIDLLQKYGYLIYPKLMQIKEAQDLAFSKTNKKQVSVFRFPGVNARRMNYALNNQNGQKNTNKENQKGPSNTTRCTNKFSNSNIDFNYSIQLSKGSVGSQLQGWSKRKRERPSYHCRNKELSRNIKKDFLKDGVKWW